MPNGDHVGAVEHYRLAVDAQDGLSYDEPPAWPWPVRETLGAALLRQGASADAEEVFRADLRITPNKPRSLVGLAATLRARHSDAGGGKSAGNGRKGDRERRHPDFACRIFWTGIARWTHAPRKEYPLTMSNGPILIISGTNRPAPIRSKSRESSKTITNRSPRQTDLLSLIELPREVFDGAAYATKPPGMIAIQQRVLDAKGLHVITPGIQRSFPGVLKYFIDMLKFPESFDRKCVAFTGESAGIWGALRSTEQLIQIFPVPQRACVPRARLHPRHRQGAGRGWKAGRSRAERAAGETGERLCEISRTCWRRRGSRLTPSPSTQYAGRGSG